MQVNYISELCGSGKTEYVLNDISNRKGHYVYAVTKIDLAEEIEERIKKLSDSIEVTTITSKNSKEGATVPERILYWQRKEKEKHEILIITQSGLLESRWNEASNLELFVDEIPEIWTFLKIANSCSWETYKSNFKLQSLETKGWSRIRLTKKGKERKNKFAEDKTFQDISQIIRKCDSNPVFTDITNWSDCDKRKTIRIWTILDFDVLSNFKTITFIGANFLESITYKILSKDNRMQFNRIRIPNTVTKNRNVNIYYFSDRMISRSYLTNEKYHVLSDIQEWILRNETRQYIWMKNLPNYKAMQEFNLSGFQLSPKSHGINNFLNFNVGIFIYSAKPEMAEAKFLDNMFELTSEDIIKSREYETIYQAAMRLSIRLQNCDDDVDIYVFDKDQAEYLKNKIGFGNISKIDINLLGQDQAEDYADRIRTTKVEKRNLIKEKRAEYMRTRRAMERLKKIKNGTYRPRGRPKKISA